MKKILFVTIIAISWNTFAQTNPAITSWLVNSTGITGRHYVANNSTPINDAVLANVQTVKYNATYSYISATGIPAYITGPFKDGNTSLATAQNKIFRIPLAPVQGTGIVSTTGGNIGVFKNGVALFDYRDGVAYSATATNGICGGPPNNPSCPGGMGTTQAWNRDAIPAEKAGFDCAKAHPAMGNYHHHQNPSAFNLDLTVISNICDAYPSDGLYVINPSEHSPLLGFAYDGFPIYGAYGYTNTNGTGTITRMKSSYQLKTQTTRSGGPNVGQTIGTQTFFNGYFKEDYEYVSHTGDATYLDTHNGRICNTPEYPASLYPNGIYCYFATVDANHNSTYPYVVGPTFYGNITVSTVNSVPSGTTTLATNSFDNTDYKVSIAPNPASEFIAIQTQMTEQDMNVELINELGQIVKTSKILQGSTLCIIDTDTVYNGIYFVKISSRQKSKSYKVIIKK
ncbi:YHYH protein [Flavobacterium luteum]|uniref:YHYH protein n=1 Tax=Flavobacterium luteum TaxID=2026654 RepID=A0A7J5AJV7_9FLAO|nr:YHYH protein [Flavobacterium luteum]KAB1157698.1 YHYH protein [Flavobacterium luteum]